MKDGSELIEVVGYGRVSTDEQATDGSSLETQVDKIEAYARLYGLTLMDTILDRGVSAKTLERPGLARALALLDAGKARGIVVAKLDRLTRSVSDMATLIDRYFGEKGGKLLFSVADSIDTRTAAGRLVLNVLMSVAQWEREIIVERTIEVLAHKRKKGERVGQVPYGQDLAADGVNLVPNDRELSTIAAMLDMRSRGFSLRRIASELTAQLIPTKSGNRKWAASTVDVILARAATLALPTRETGSDDASSTEEQALPEFAVA